jgi:adenosine deaminase
MRAFKPALAVLLLASLLDAQAAPERVGVSRSAIKNTSREAAAAARMDRIAARPALLRIFLQAMPKGGDLHHHLSGAIYAEDYIAWAGDAGLCIDARNVVVAPPCNAPKIAAKDLGSRDYDRYSKVIDAFSTRGFEKGVNDPTLPGYERFFSTFARFGMAGDAHGGAMIAAARETAADNHVSYLETMSNPTVPRTLGDAATAASATGTDFAAMDAAVAPLLPAAIAAASREVDGMEADADRLQGCKTTAPAPGCAVMLRYQGFAVRTRPPAQVFAALAFAFALADADPRYVGVNIVAPEHEPVAVRDYGLHMRMLAWLKARHPRVKLDLHAGELTLGLVVPRSLRFHIRDAVEIAGASRIGHGVDIPYESDAPALMKEMAARKIAVEINLTSNAVILGVTGKDHPLVAYRAAGVPVVLSTDDEGVSRSDMTNEYMRAVTEQGLRYRDLKQMARASLDYSFLSAADKAKAKAALEKQFAAFEAALPGP